MVLQDKQESLAGTGKPVAEAFKREV